jgi:hypothetical protein
MSPTGAAWDFFLIHSSFDKPDAEELYRLLTDRNHHVFLDRAAIPPGATWPAALDAALRDTRVFVVLISPQLSAAHYALEEIVIAVKEKRAASDARSIVPVRLASAAQTPLPYGLVQYQAVEAADSAGMPGVVSALEQVLGGLGSFGSAPVARPVTPPAHALQAYPRAVFVRPELVPPNLIKAVAEIVPAWEAGQVIAEANAYRLEADPGDSSVTLMQRISLPPPEFTPPYAYWLAAFGEGRRNGTRMFAALLKTVCPRLPDEQAKLDCQRVLEKLRHISA